MDLQQLIEKHSLKLGDKVICSCNDGYTQHFKLGKHTITTLNGHDLGIIGKGFWHGNGCAVEFELPTPYYPNPPHKHAELIKAWADGADIQYEYSQVWVDKKNPRWDGKGTYRIKPTKSDKDIQIEKLEEQAKQLASDIAKLKGG